MAGRRGKGRNRGAWIIGGVLLAAGLFAALTPVVHKAGRGPGWDIMPDDWFARPVRGDPATWASKGPRLTLEVAAARVAVMPEDRPDIAVTAAPGLRVVRDGANVTVSDGSRPPGWFARRCGPGKTTEPTITVRAPRNLAIASRGHVTGTIGPMQDLQLVSAGCGRWDIAAVEDVLRLAQKGVGDIHATTARLATARIDGDGRIELAKAREGLDAYVDGPGVMTAGQVEGRLDAELWGRGAIVVSRGFTQRAFLFAKGRGHIEHGGVISTLTAEAREKAVIRIGVVAGTVSGVEKGGGLVRYSRPANRRFCRGMACD